MDGKRLALVLGGVGLIALGAGGVSTSSGQSQSSPGLTYGGLKDQYSAWLRLDPGRRSIASMQIDWAIAPERCSNRRSFSDTMYAGYEERTPIGVGADGTFHKTVVDRFRDGGGRYEETQTVNGRIQGFFARGTIRTRVRWVKPSGQVVRCESRSQGWQLVD
jgi:hypothetical protein